MFQAWMSCGRMRGSPLRHLKLQVHHCVHAHHESAIQEQSPLPHPLLVPSVCSSHHRHWFQPGFQLVSQVFGVTAAQTVPSPDLRRRARRALRGGTRNFGSGAAWRHAVVHRPETLLKAKSKISTRTIGATSLASLGTWPPAAGTVQRLNR